jgi:hypothetical protein
MAFARVDVKKKNYIFHILVIVFFQFFFPVFEWMSDRDKIADLDTSSRVREYELG